VTDTSNEKHNKLWTPGTYRIEVEGQLAESWSDRLEAIALPSPPQNRIIALIADSRGGGGALRRIREKEGVTS